MAAPQAWSWSNPTVFSTRASWLRWLETPATHRKRLTASARRALEMLATDFATEKIMLDQGFTSGLLTDLLRTNLAMRYSAPKVSQQAAGEALVEHDLFGGKVCGEHL